MVYRMRTYDEFLDISNIKYFPSKITSYTLLTGIYEITDNKNNIKVFATR